jgi:hypothetical protein
MAQGRKGTRRETKKLTVALRKKVQKNNKTPVHTCKTVLGRPILGLKAHIDTRDSNSDYKGRKIDPLHVELWDDFLTVEEVVALWKDNPEFEAVMEREWTAEESGRCLHGKPVTGANLNEMELEALWRSNAHHTINLVSEICAKELQGTDTPTFAIMGDGASATWTSPKAEKGAKRKKPDYAGYITRSDDTQYSGKGTSLLMNRIPGDAKLFRKIRREWLPPDGAAYLEGKYEREAIKVLSQVHGYMDAHEARYGYIVNNEELIFLRRRDTGWGQIDISPAIRHDVDVNTEPGVLNSKYVLFYFHWKIANDETSDGWRLRSFGQEPDIITNDIPSPATKRPQLMEKAKVARAEKTETAVQSLLPSLAFSLVETVAGWVTGLACP